MATSALRRAATAAVAAAARRQGASTSPIAAALLLSRRLGAPLAAPAWSAHMPSRPLARELVTRAASGGETSSSSSSANSDDGDVPAIARDPPPKCAADIVKRIGKGKCGMGA